MIEFLRSLFGRQSTAATPEQEYEPWIVPEDPRLDPYRRPCWIPQAEDGDGAVQASKFSGVAALLPGESWPACPNCSQPMQLFLQLHAADLPDGFAAPWGEGILQFFYCTTSKPCCEVQCKAWDPFSHSTLLRIVPATAGSSATQLPATALPARHIAGWERQDDLPSGEELRSFGFSLEEEEEISESDYSRKGDKLAGWPFWLQSMEYPECPECGAGMKLLFQIDSNGNLDYMFGDAGCGHLTYCEKHPHVLAFGWACG